MRVAEQLDQPTFKSFAYPGELQLCSAVVSLSQCPASNDAGARVYKVHVEGFGSHAHGDAA